MSEFPKYPTDFLALTRPFEDEEIEKLLSQNIKDLVWTIDNLKKREVNATKAVEDRNLEIEKLRAELSDLRRREIENQAFKETYKNLL